MKMLIIKSLFALIFLIEFYPVEAYPQNQYGKISNDNTLSVENKSEDIKTAENKIDTEIQKNISELLGEKEFEILSANDDFGYNLNLNYSFINSFAIDENTIGSCMNYVMVKDSKNSYMYLYLPVSLREVDKTK